MSDDANVMHSHPAEEKEPQLKAETENPKQHGSEVHGIVVEESVPSGQ